MSFELKFLEQTWRQGSADTPAFKYSQNADCPDSQTLRCPQI